LCWGLGRGEKDHVNIAADDLICRHGMHH
jgi:hypothetical protein